MSEERWQGGLAQNSSQTPAFVAEWGMLSHPPRGTQGGKRPLRDPVTEDWVPLVPVGLLAAVSLQWGELVVVGTPVGKGQC